MKYYKDKIHSCDGYQKALFQLSNHLLFKRINNILPTYLDTKKLADDFSEIFYTKIENIRKVLLQTRTYDPTLNIQNSSVRTLHTFESITESKLKEIIMSSTVL